LFFLFYKQMTTTRKIVINTCFGGFGLSKLATAAVAERKNMKLADFSVYELARDDYDLITVVEALGEEADGQFSKLKVVEIPADVNWDIAEYDGVEHVYEVHRTWE